jgi:hypothetical protein
MPGYLQFRKMYERGDIPASIVHGVKNTLNWRTPLDKIDYHRFLPVFFEGIREKEDPYRFLAVKVRQIGLNWTATKYGP